MQITKIYLSEMHFWKNKKKEIVNARYKTNLRHVKMRRLHFKKETRSW